MRSDYHFSSKIYWIYLFECMVFKRRVYEALEKDLEEIVFCLRQHSEVEINTATCNLLHYLEADF